MFDLFHSICANDASELRFHYVPYRQAQSTTYIKVRGRCTGKLDLKKKLKLNTEKNAVHGVGSNHLTSMSKINSIQFGTECIPRALSVSARLILGTRPYDYITYNSRAHCIQNIVAFV